MPRTHYKPRTHHRDGYHPSATLATLTRNNGRDLLDVQTAEMVSEIVETAARRVRDRYEIMGAPATRAELLAFRRRQRALRAAKVAA